MISISAIGTSNNDWEPGRKGKYYANLPLFAQSLGRISDLSERLAKAELVIDEPAHMLWKEKRPLVRKFKLSAEEWVVLAVQPLAGRRCAEQHAGAVRCENCRVAVGGPAYGDLPGARRQYGETVMHGERL